MSKEDMLRTANRPAQERPLGVWHVRSFSISLQGSKHARSRWSPTRRPGRYGLQRQIQQPPARRSHKCGRDAWASPRRPRRHNTAPRPREGAASPPEDGVPPVQPGHDQFEPANPVVAPLQVGQLMEQERSTFILPHFRPEFLRQQQPGRLPIAQSIGGTRPGTRQTTAASQADTLGEFIGSAVAITPPPAGCL